VLEHLFRTTKSAIKRRFPRLAPVYGCVYRYLVLHLRLRRMTVEEVFERIYRTNGWEGNESASGRGSTLAATTAIRQALPTLAVRFNTRSMLDIPCGDGHWMSQVPMELDRYIGADVVRDLVANCSARWPRHENAQREFLCLDVIADQLPSVDLVFCRDCLVHLSFAHISSAIANIKKSGSTYLLTTTYPGRRNWDIATGGWRPINLQAKPFGFPPPLVLVNEQCAAPGYRDKSMGLWCIGDVP
jgi:Methyltransferase domain